MPELVLVTDFDGTISAQDFYDLAVRELLKPEDIQPWNDFTAGKITHFTAMQRIFGNIRAPESRALTVLEDMGLEAWLDLDLGPRCPITGRTLNTPNEEK